MYSTINVHHRRLPILPPAPCTTCSTRENPVICNLNLVLECFIRKRSAQLAGLPPGAAVELEHPPVALRQADHNPSQACGRITCAQPAAPARLGVPPSGPRPDACHNIPQNGLSTHGLSTGRGHLGPRKGGGDWTCREDVLDVGPGRGRPCRGDFARPAIRVRDPSPDPSHQPCLGR